MGVKSNWKENGKYTNKEKKRKSDEEVKENGKCKGN